MSFGSFDQNNHQPMAEINTTPLVDVMLVLLIIFMITAPMMTHSVKINLPSTTGQTEKNETEAINIEIDALGKFYWQQQQLSLLELQKKLNMLDNSAKVYILSDKKTPYQHIADIMQLAKTENIKQLSFKLLSQSSSQ